MGKVADRLEEIPKLGKSCSTQVAETDGTDSLSLSAAVACLLAYVCFV